VPTEEHTVRWKDLSTQKAFLDKLAIKLNIQKPEDWTKVTTNMAVKEGGHFIDRYYKGSLAKGKSAYILYVLT
jgi:hypothetical protein